MTSWFDDPKQLIRSDKVLNFWPSTTLTPEERINATARFIIYATCIKFVHIAKLRFSYFPNTNPSDLSN